MAVFAGRNEPVENGLLAALHHDELIMTQELIADMLGVRREGVTVAAGRLQDTGAISYVRGHIKISIVRSWKGRSASVTGWSKTSSIDC